MDEELGNENINEHEEILTETNANSETQISLIRSRTDEVTDTRNKRTKADPKILDGKFFQIRLREGDRVQATCCICGVHRWGSVKGTGNFTRHISDKHSERQHEMNIYLKQVGNGNSTLRQTTLKNYTSVSNEQLCELVLDFVIDSNLPFRIVQSHTFKELLSKVSCKDVVMPSIAKTMTALNTRFDSMKCKLIEELNKQEWVCLTADIWSHLRKSYLGVSVHYIDSQWKRKSYILAFRYLNRRHTYDYLAEVLNSILKEFNLDVDKITHIVTDGGSNFCKAFIVYGRKNDFNETLMAISVNSNDDGSEEDVSDHEMLDIMENNDNNIFDMESERAVQEANIEGNQIDIPNHSDDIDIEIILPPQMRCFAHLLNLIGKVDFLQELENYEHTYGLFMGAYGKLKKIWNKASRSSVVSATIQEIMKCALVTPTPTRWNSEWDSMNHAHKNRNGINDVCKVLNASGHKELKELTTTEWNIVNDYVKLLHPVARSLDKLQGEKNVSIGSVMPCLFYIEKEISQVHLSTSQSTNTKIRAIASDMRKSLTKVFENRFSSFMKFERSNCDLILAAVTHPVYKFKWIDDVENVVIARSYLETEMIRISNNPQNTAIAESNDSDDEFLPSTSITHRRMSDEDIASNEIFNFIDDNDKQLSMSKYERISVIYRKHNTTLSSSAPIERLFSQAMLISTPRRNRLSNTNFEKTLLLKKNKDLSN